MNMAFPPCLNRTDWKTLYRAAILETNKSALPQRVSKAEEAVIGRRREIFYDHGTPEEKDDLEGRTVCLACVQKRLAAHRSCIVPSFGKIKVCDYPSRQKCHFRLYKPDSPMGLHCNWGAGRGVDLESGTKLVLRVSLCQRMIATCWTC